MSMSRPISPQAMPQSINDQEKALLLLAQSDFPLCEQPFAVLAEQVGMSEAEVITLLKKWREDGLIRRIGPVFSPAALGWKSTLCAAAVPAEKLDEFVALVNARPEVTHNYLRDHSQNVWFTLIAPGEQAILKIIAELEAATGVKISNLPAEKVFKLKAEFKPD